MARSAKEGRATATTLMYLDLTLRDFHVSGCSSPPTPRSSRAPVLSVFSLSAENLRPLSSSSVASSWTTALHVPLRELWMVSGD